jgi:hypothetical protein
MLLARSLFVKPCWQLRSCVPDANGWGSRHSFRFGMYFLGSDLGVLLKRLFITLRVVNECNRLIHNNKLFLPVLNCHLKVKNSAKGACRL